MAHESVIPPSAGTDPGNLSQLFAVRAYQVADASAVASVDYTQLIFAGVYGYFLFGEQPTVSTVVGGLIIVAASLYIVRGESGPASTRGE
ncbi:MAG: DMT family transporter [Martelella sp.]|uniref:DMT family transporter n=1 Tax=Martelella sp. TaxID=1969699 RepID=UPI003241C4F3